MFENGEATDVVTKSHKGSSTEANKSADKAVCLDVARRGWTRFSDDRDGGWLTQ